MSQLLSSLFTNACSHQFAWPRRSSDGTVYQVCLLCGDCFRYDWDTMSRGGRFDVTPEMDTSRRTAWKPRSRRIRWQEPMLYRESGMAEWNAGTVQNISKSGVSFVGEQRVENGIELEMIFVIPQEVIGQPNSKVLCRGDVARVAAGNSGDYAVAVAMSGYSFLPDV
jgi:hypothetical protein